MGRVVALVGVVIAALVLAGGAAAGIASIRSFEVVPGDRSLATSDANAAFDLVGVHWRGPGGVELRTLSAGGRWSTWSRVTEDDDGPAPVGWRIGPPLWVGHSLKVEVRPVGRVARIRVFTVRSPVVRVPLRTTASPGAPAIVPRSGWLADESLRRAPPELAPTLRMAFIHHTAGSNAYTRAQAPAVVRGIQLYHVKGNGWNDIGYNALVDRYGTVYEGRFGGLGENVIGAHARGFNTGSFGIAVMGDFRQVDPPKPAVDALVRTLAWRLDLAFVDPLGTFTATSLGNERFAAGAPVVLRAISGHRDTGATTCPGQRLYDLIPTIAKRVAATGLPKLYAPQVVRDETGAIHFTARVSGTQPWAVVVTDAIGTELARQTGSGPTIDWAWAPAMAVDATARWRIEVPGATTAEGTLGISVAGELSLGEPAVTPAVISPNGDGLADTATISLNLSTDANLSAVVLDETGAEVAELEPPRWRRAGPRTLTFGGSGLPDGRYVVRLTARAAGGSAVDSDVSVAVSNVLGLPTLSTRTLVPRRGALKIAFSLASTAAVRVTLAREGRWVATLLDGPLEAGPQHVTWDGQRASGHCAGRFVRGRRPGHGRDRHESCGAAVHPRCDRTGAPRRHCGATALVGQRACDGDHAREQRPAQSRGQRPWQLSDPRRGAPDDHRRDRPGRGGQCLTPATAPITARPRRLAA